MTPRRIWPFLTVPFLLLGLAACSDSRPTAPEDPDAASDEAAVLLDVTPHGDATGVDIETVITIEFSHSMEPAMSAYADVHEGELAGPEVTGTWEWHENDTILRFTPSDPLQLATDYVVHLGGGMGGVDGKMDPSGHMGGNRDHPSNGSHGMIFTFTTEGRVSFAGGVSRRQGWRSWRCDARASGGRSSLGRITWTRARRLRDPRPQAMAAASNSNPTVL